MEEGVYNLSGLSEELGIELIRELLNRELKLDLGYTTQDLWDASSNTVAKVVFDNKINQDILLNQVDGYRKSYGAKKLIVVFFDNRNEKLSSLEEKISEVYKEYRIFYLDWIQDRLSKFPEIAKKYGIELIQTEKKIVNKREDIHRFIETRKMFSVGHFHGEGDQIDRFIEERTWQNGYETKHEKEINQVKERDLLFLKSTYVAKGSNYLRVKGVGIVQQNHNDGRTLDVLWYKFSTHINLEGLGALANAFRLVKEDYSTRIITGLLKKEPNLLSIIDSLTKKVQIMGERQFWWLYHKESELRNLAVGSQIIHQVNLNSELRQQRYVNNIGMDPQTGDFVIGYDDEYGKVVALLEVIEVSSSKTAQDITLEVIAQFEGMIDYEKVWNLPSLVNSELIYANEKFLKLDRNEFLDIIEATDYRLESLLDQLTEETKRPQIQNDGAYTGEDLLDIENDVRAFAMVLASKDIKPPIAIALFGKWGLGKSFFMRHLEKRIGELSLHQRFLEKGDGKNPQKGNEEWFCKGVAQITFNAWSYLDANLWAGLVSSIFEKLDEYISSRSKGEKETQKLREKLTEELEILSTEKNKVLENKNDLEKEKKGVEKKLEKLKKEKEELIKNIASKNLKTIYSEVLEKVSLDEEIEKELQKYGVETNQLKKESPNALYNEAKSWVTFFKHLTEFSTFFFVLFMLAGGVLLAVWLDPKGVVTQYMTSSGRQIIAMITIAGPVLAKWYKSFNQFKKIIQPVIQYKDTFNKELDAVKFKYKQEKELLEIQLEEEQRKIEYQEGQLNKLSEKIEEVEYNIAHFSPKRVFNDFIKRKSDNKEYDQYLGLISVIRRDFETLSDLFREIEIDGTASLEVQAKQAEKKKKHDEIVDLFKDEKTLDRIILYIDDLDRCSDEKVLEVIQAVHLLMAFPLFNVVVGVDKRCVNNALIYKNLIQYSQFSPLTEVEEVGIHVISPDEYLEKIFQIPFQLEAPQKDNISAMIDHMLDGQILIEEKQEKENKFIESTIADVKEEKVEKSIENSNNEEKGTIEYRTVEKKRLTTHKDLQLREEEVLLLKEMVFLAGNTPRTIKRFVNIYRIIKSHHEVEEKGKDGILAILFILAMNIGSEKDNADKLFEKIEEEKEKSLNVVLKTLKMDSVIKVIEENESIKELLTYTGEVHFNLHLPFIKRFSFC